MEDVGPPAADALHRQLGGGEAEAGEANRIVAEFIAVGVAVRRTVAVVKLGAQHEIDDEPIGLGELADRAGRDRAGAGQVGDDVDRRRAAQGRAVGRGQHARIATGTQGARQRRRDFSEAARLEKIAEFGRDEQRFANDLEPR